MTNEIQTTRQHDVLRGFFELNYLALVTHVEVATHGAKSDLVADVHTALTLQWRPEPYRLSSAYLVDSGSTTGSNDSNPRRCLVATDLYLLLRNLRQSRPASEHDDIETNTDWVSNDRSAQVSYAGEQVVYVQNPGTRSLCYQARKKRYLDPAVSMCLQYGSESSVHLLLHRH